MCCTLVENNVPFETHVASRLIWYQYNTYLWREIILFKFPKNYQAKHHTKFIPEIFFTIKHLLTILSVNIDISIFLLRQSWMNIKKSADMLTPCMEGKVTFFFFLHIIDVNVMADFSAPLNLILLCQKWVFLCLWENISTVWYYSFNILYQMIISEYEFAFKTPQLPWTYLSKKFQLLQALWIFLSAHCHK
jgi:hypothetical protein